MEIPLPFWSKPSFRVKGLSRFKKKRTNVKSVVVSFGLDTAAS